MDNRDIWLMRPAELRAGYYCVGCGEFAQESNYQRHIVIRLDPMTRLVFCPPCLDQMQTKRLEGGGGEVN